MTVNTRNLWQRLHDIMSDMSGTILKKQKKDKVPYPVLTHDAVNAEITPLLIQHGVIAIPAVRGEKLEIAKTTNRDGNEINQFVTRVILDITFVNIDNPTERETVTMIGDGIDSSDKGPGKGISYAFKYGMLKLFGLATGVDSEDDNFQRGRGSTSGTSPRGGDSVASQKDKATGFACPREGCSGKLLITVGKYGPCYICTVEKGKPRFLKKAEWVAAKLIDPEKFGDKPVSSDDLTKKAIFDMMKRLRDLEGGNETISHICGEHRLSGSGKAALKGLTTVQLNAFHKDLKEALSGDVQ